MATLGELQDRLRLRIGETDAAASQLWTADELTLALNIAQEECSKDLHQHGREWSAKMEVRLPVEDDVTYYLAPEDFMFLEKIGHYFPGYSPKELVPADVDALRMNSWSVHDRYETRYEFYEVQGRTSGYYTAGTAEEGSDAIELADTNLMTSEIRTGDLVHNIEDESTAEIVGFGRGFAQLDNWQGGTSQRFYAGNSYRIQRPERTRYQIYVWPLVRVESPIIYDDTPRQVELDKDIVVQDIYFQVTSVPPDWEEDDLVLISTFEDRTLLPEQRWGQQQVRVGYNRILALKPFKMAQNVPYEFSFTASGDVNVEKVRIEIENKNFLELNYVALPRPLTNLDSFTEFPTEYIEPLIDYAKMLAYDKKYPNGEFRASLMNVYIGSRDRTKEYKLIASRSGNDHVQRSEERFYENNKGYTRVYGDV